MQDLLIRISEWLTGGPVGYQTLLHCLRHDYTWIALIVLVDLTIFFGYVRIALNWGKHAGDEENSTAKRSLHDMRNVFVFCGVTYIWTSVDLVWPAWRLLFLAKLALAFYTWRYVRQTHNLAVLYADLDKVKNLEHKVNVLETQVVIWKARAQSAQDRHES